MTPAWTDDIARKYLQSYGDHALNRLWLNHIELVADEFLLDIGCGGGTSIKAAITVAPEIRATGIDPMPVMLAAARVAVPSADFYEAGAESIPLPGSVVTLALANCSIIHWENLVSGLKETRRVLRPKGRFLIIEEAFASQDEEGRLNSPQELPEHLERSGFTVAQHGHHSTDRESYWATLAQKV